MPLFVKTRTLTPNGAALNQRLKDLAARQNRVMSSALESIQPGMTPVDIADVARQAARTNDVELSFRKFQNFPDDLSIGTGQYVMNAVPDKNRRLKEGDTVRIALGTHDAGTAFSTQNWSVVVGQARAADEQVLHATKAALQEVLPMFSVGAKYSEIVARLKSISAQKNFYLNPFFAGHPIGERPILEPHMVAPGGLVGHDAILSEGAMLSVFVLGHQAKPDLHLCEDGWTLKDREHLPSACFSHMVLVTDGEPQVLTAGYS